MLVSVHIVKGTPDDCHIARKSPTETNYMYEDTKYSSTYSLLVEVCTVPVSLDR
jgi:hypothetical protein